MGEERVGIGMIEVRWVCLRKARTESDQGSMAAPRSATTLFAAGQSFHVYKRQLFLEDAVLARELICYWMGKKA